MSRSNRITDIQGDGWSFIYDARKAPEYVLLTLSGSASLARTERLIEAMRFHRPQTELLTGDICPVIVDMRENEPPPAAVLRAEYEMVDAVTSQVSCIVFLLDPKRADATQLRLALEAIGLFAAPNMVAVTSMAEAMRAVQAYHQRHGSRGSRP